MAKTFKEIAKLIEVPEEISSEGRFKLTRWHEFAIAAAQWLKDNLPKAQVHWEIDGTFTNKEHIAIITIWFTIGRGLPVTCRCYWKAGRNPPAFLEGIEQIKRCVENEYNEIHANLANLERIEEHNRKLYGRD